MNLVILTDSFLWDSDKIVLEDGYVEIGKEKFVAVGIEKSKTSEHWEESDRINVIILVKGYNEKYYILKIEHYVSEVLSPKYIENEFSLCFVENKLTGRELISDLYAISDSRDEYTLSIYNENHERKIYHVYEKYIDYKISVSYETEDFNLDSSKAATFFWIRCQISSMHNVDYSETLENTTIQYPMFIRDLLRTHVFERHYFKIWKGKVTINGVKVTLE